MCPQKYYSQTRIVEHRALLKTLVPYPSIFWSHVYITGSTAESTSLRAEFVDCVGPEVWMVPITAAQLRQPPPDRTPHKIPVTAI